MDEFENAETVSIIHAKKRRRKGGQGALSNTHHGGVVRKYWNIPWSAKRKLDLFRRGATRPNDCLIDRYSCRSRRR
jgi:hypothetical protein